MNGKEFKAIRRFNKVSQIDVAYKLGLNTRRMLWEVENQSAVPSKYIAALSELIKVDLTNSKITEKILNEIPEKYFITEKRHSFYRF